MSWESLETSTEKFVLHFQITVLLSQKDGLAGYRITLRTDFFNVALTEVSFRDDSRQTLLDSLERTNLAGFIYF